MAKAGATALETPMMRQYLEVKAERPDCLLLMRMGDFYEAFLEDAQELARICQVALTSRNKEAEDRIPMAGVPHHSLPQHLPRLLAAGKRVAVMDQLEDPKDAKGLVRRGITRVISPGTVVDELAEAPTQPLVALTGVDGRIGIAALALATGRFTVEEAADAQALSMALARLQPAELLVPEAVREDEAAAGRLATLVGTGVPISSLPAYAWKGADARRHLCERLRVQALEAFGIGPAEDHLAAAAAAALRYAAGSLRIGSADAVPGRPPATLDHIATLSRLHPAECLVLDAVCRRNLELVRNSRDGGRDGTLLAAIDRTRTAPGTRLLAEWLARPLAAVAPIQARQDAIAGFLADDALRADLRAALGGCYDLERLLARLATGRIGPRDLVQLAHTLRAARTIATSLHGEQAPLVGEARAALAAAPDLGEAIARTLVDEPPVAVADGDLIRPGVDADLDGLRAIRTDAASWLAAYQAREAERCGLPRLKVGYNKVFGYYIEVSKANGERVPAHFIRKQTLVGAERYITPELKEYEDRALGAEDRIRERERHLFEELRTAALAAMPALRRCAEAIAQLDCWTALAETARAGGWCRPVIDDGADLVLVQARHPVVEQVVPGGTFVPNDTHLRARSDDPAAPRLAVITGPNMAGKSTYIRQVALAVILAQAGSFVPAREARIGLVDRVFTRVGAGDELSRNQSTFMVEMAEAAAILHHASARSLVVLDEVGRGTSTFDGLSLAWAITEHLHDAIGCRTLFATHYHELADLAADRAGIANATVAVAEQDDDIVFLHRIVPGAAAKSYGIHVARLAGVPPAVVARARAVLATLESLNGTLQARERPQAQARPRVEPVQLTLFTPPSPTLAELRALAVDELTPRQALEALYRLQAQARGDPAS